MRFLTKLLIGALFAGAAADSRGQSPSSGVVPPSNASLDVVNLRTEWTTAIPLINRQDAVGLIQVTDGNQMFIQTRSGVLIALDAKTGAQQWTLKYEAANVPLHDVAVNDRYVVATNLATMYLLDRYTGLQEFKYKLPLVPSAPPTMDLDTIYLALNGQRVTAYALPQAVSMPERLNRAKADATTGGVVSLTGKNPADVVATRYPSTSRNIPFTQPVFDEPKVSVGANVGGTAGTLGAQRSPSLSIPNSVRPPYTAFDQRGKYLVKSDSLSTVHSLRQPYSIQDPTGAQIQRTPSISAIPPSVAGVLERSSLLPRGLEPKARWVIGSSVRLTHSPLTTNFRVWMSGDAPQLQAILKEDRALQVSARIPNLPAAQPVQAEDVAYFPLVDGNLLAIDMTSGGGSVAKLNWRSNVGGAMNRKPYLTKDSVYQGGDTSGVARVDRKTGEVIWRTDDVADTILGATEEVVYVRDKQGIVRVYDKNRVTDLASKRAIQIGAINLSGFTVQATNDQTDRLFMASDTGLLICLRDKAAKYATAMSVVPPLHKIDPTILRKADPNPPMPTGVTDNPLVK
ncbi:outer membrane protein assembly factor BamB family protein [Limnoglobus roseus]|uniref:Outer membrane protein assembly factor BamB n=1 Tax=Limnoglobus roseus TaxID=2598579 RepID=A0A5C1ACV1_9BACT|nr:PQQ-binding-like beta-propeller repeat protein [Limnoglobus roseus]QEL15826.1 Outer membrane protein assembly factor BamB [Limnoglobus roseus]